MAASTGKVGGAQTASRHSQPCWVVGQYEGKSGIQWRLSDKYFHNVRVAVCLCFSFFLSGVALLCFVFVFHQEKKIRFEAVFSYCVAMLRTTLFVAAASAVAALSDDSYGQASPVISWSGVEEYVHIAGT